MNYFSVNVKNISKSFGSIEAISRGFSCGFHRSTNTVLLGRNGAGKTTLLNLITNTLLLDSGSIYINGCDNRAPNSRMTPPTESVH
ncbi:MAG: ATP-binding cassette domain-containing protein [Candidatus Aegiribacteria sp.]|nr:ATP-binding cassette domain-containing protein [Candidatus Aegiribacteria sp.]